VPELTLGHFNTMKHITHCCIVFLAAALVGCRSTKTPDPTYIPTWNQIQVGMTRQQVYAIAGKPLRETESEAEWKSPQAREGWPDATIYWRKLDVYFDANGRVTNMRNYEQQK
jgi:outer membrane protein assembly factor BamE (lipoprotein component of BamABCDE complex)